MAYIGQSIKNGTFTDLGFTGTFNSSTTDFNLGTQLGSAAQILVSKNGVVQRPGTDFTLASGGSQISFTTAPASGDSIFIVEISGAVGGPINRDINGDELILDVDGDTSITADTDDQIDFKIGGSDKLRITATALVPSSDDAYDLGTSSLQFRDIYTGDLNLNNTMSRNNEVDGTSGSWTIQEGENDLYILNRLNGKKYKFKLEEIE